mgnify:CR=1 FL=1
MDTKINSTCTKIEVPKEVTEFLEKKTKEYLDELNRENPLQLQLVSDGKIEEAYLVKGEFTVIDGIAYMWLHAQHSRITYPTDGS